MTRELKERDEEMKASFTHGRNSSEPDSAPAPTSKRKRAAELNRELNANGVNQSELSPDMRADEEEPGPLEATTSASCNIASDDV
ncbi:hypothetical protein G5I_09723 [Acromyrmex echinatior]|uniref:Uncharacterized protein n=1 Tax=Acromyrmex echinatior TaxID=103372 RepID=F4WUZ2_ACREC|nr:hypothetical protein G5I_09723 [Acromyrmex echinatior]